MIVNFEKFIVVFIVVLFVIYVSYYLSFLKYDDYEFLADNLIMVENDNLKKRVLQLEEAMNIKSDNDFIISQVLVREIYNFYDEIIIGSSDVSVGDAVFNSEGLVGIVKEVKDERSVISLLSSDVNVSVSINGVYGNYNQGYVSMLDKYSDIKIGDKVYTSGLTTIPSGIYVGEVINVQNESDGLGLVAQIKIVNNKDLNYVAIARSNA